MPDLKMILDRYFYAMLLVLIVGGMGFIKPETFLTWSNISVVVFQQAPLTILMSFGMTLAIIAKGIDVSMGSVLVLSSVLSAGFIKSDDIMLGMCIALMNGAFFGFLNGVLITGVGIDPFIATYGMSSVALGLAYVYTGGIYIYDFPPRFREISNGSVL